MEIKTITERLRENVLMGKTTLREASEELFKYGHTPFVKDDKETALYLGIAKHIKMVEGKNQIPESINEDTLYVWRNWNQEGALWYEGAKTIHNYIDIRHEADTHHHHDVFYAFSDKQFIEGLREIGIIDHDIPMSEAKEICKDKVFSIGCGGFATKEGYKDMVAYINAISERITKECCPQEVYLYEYNNHECMIDWDGDDRAMEVCLLYWSTDVCKTIKRYNRNTSVDDLAKKN